MRMMLTYIIESHGETAIRVPIGAQLRNAHYGLGWTPLWFEAPDRDAPTMTRNFAWFEDGQEVPDGWIWRATTPHNGAAKHLFERHNDPMAMR